MSFPPRSPEQWEEWWQGFKKRNGLDSPLPAPPSDAPPPPKDTRLPDDEKETMP